MAANLYEALGERVARLRKRLKITQEALGSRVDMSRATVASIEAGRQRVTLDQLYLLGSALEIDDLSELIPLRIPAYKPLAGTGEADLNPIQAAQIDAILRSAIASARTPRKRS